MNLLDLDNLGGVKTYQETLAFMQTAYTAAIGNIAALIGNNVILEGCEVAGGNLTAGTMIINGEILPFEAGVNTGFLTVVETVTNAPYMYGGAKPFYKQRKVTATVAGIPVGSLVRLSTLKAHYSNVSNPHNVDKNQVGLGNLPNAKSDSAMLADSNTLATSAAVYNALKSIKNGTASGSITGSGTIVVTHNLGNTNYRIFITNTSTYTNEFVNAGHGVIAKTANNFTVRVDTNSLDALTYRFDWVIFPY